MNIKKTKEQKKKNKRITIINLVLAAVAVASILAIIFWPYSKSMAKENAFSTDGYEMDTIMFNYFYRDCYDSFLNAFGDMVKGQGLIESGISLAEQEYSEELSWAEFFYETAAGNAKRSMIVYLAATETGYVLPENAVTEIDDQIGTIEQNASAFGYTDGTAFLQTHYGPAADMDTYREYLIFAAIANRFSGDYYSSIYYSEEETRAWFEEKYPDSGDQYDYNSLDFRMIYIPFTEYSYNEAQGTYGYAEENQTSVYAQIQAVYALYMEGEQTEELFAELASEYSYYDRANGGLYENALKDDSNVESQVLTWIFKNGRAYGDTAIVEADSGDYVLYWIGEDMPAWEYMAQSGMRSENWNAWYESLAADIEITENGNILNDLYLIA